MKMAFSRDRLLYPLLALFCALASLALGWSAYANRINGNFYDLYFRQRGPQPPSENIVIVAIDDESLARYGALPWDRSLLAEGIQAIQQARPRLLAVDVLLSDLSTAESDGDLQAALAEPSRTVLATALEANATGRWLHPLPIFAVLAAAVGHVHADPDGDGVSRRVLLEKQSGRERRWALALESFRLWQGTEKEPITETDDALEVARSGGAFGERRPAALIPAARADQRALLINYAGGNGTFQQIGFASLLSRPELRQRELRQRLTGAIVLLGVTAQGAGDRLFTPFSTGIGMAGVEIHAHILHTLLSEKYLRPVSEFGAALAVVFIALGTAWVLSRFYGLKLVVLLAAMGLVVLALPYWLFLRGQVWPGFSLLLPFAMTALLCGTYQLLLVRRKFADSEEKRRRSQQRFEMAAHEIRTPLTAIQGSSELLYRYPLDDAKRERMIRLISEESQRLGKLVERFLSVERLSAGEMELRRAPLDLSSLLSATIERLGPMAERKGIRLVRQDQTAGTEIEADPELLEFAVSNLVTNAVKYSPPGTAVTLALERERGQVHIHVSDNGPGMTAEETRRIFDRFYRTDDARRSEAPGFGLGLAIAREIACHHGGDLRVESKPGAGSRFTLTLPATASARQPKESAG